MQKMETKRIKVLLIGANSYIGRNFINYCTSDLNPTDEVEAVVEVQAISGKSGEWKNASFAGYDCVMLLSGIVHNKAKPQLYYDVNYNMAVEIAQKSKESGVKQFILFSTIGVYGAGVWFKKDSILAPITDYAKSKRMAEEAINQLQSEEFVVAIVRPPMVYGKDCPGNFGRLVKLIRKVHMFPIYQNGRSAIYILNLCEFLRCLIIKECAGYYVPQNSEYLCTSNIAEVMKQKGIPVLLLRGCSGMIRLASKCSGQISKIFGDYKFSLKDSCYEGIDYQKFSTLESIKESIESFHM